MKQLHSLKPKVTTAVKLYWIGVFDVDFLLKAIKQQKGFGRTQIAVELRTKSSAGYSNFKTIHFSKDNFCTSSLVCSIEDYEPEKEALTVCNPQGVAGEKIEPEKEERK
jgi:hypothetical protein